MEVELRKTSKPDDDGDIEEPQTQQRQFEVNLDLSEFIIDDGAIKELSDLVNLLIELLEIKMENFRMISIECLGHLSARKVFEKMPHRKEALCDLYEHNLVEDWLILFPFDRGKAFAIPIDQESIKWPYDRGKGSSSNSPRLILVDSFCEHHNHVSSLPFGRRIVCTNGIQVQSVSATKFIFDPGIYSVGIGMSLSECWLMVDVQKSEFSREGSYHFESARELISLPDIDGIVLKLVGNAYCSLRFLKKGQRWFPFDRGRDSIDVIGVHRWLKKILVFDPGGALDPCMAIPLNCNWVTT